MTSTNNDSNNDLFARDELLELELLGMDLDFESLMETDLAL